MRSLRFIVGILLFLLISCGRTGIKFKNESGAVITRIEFIFNSKLVSSSVNPDIRNYEFKFEPKEDGILMLRMFSNDGKIYENNNIYLTASHGGSVEIIFNQSKEIKFVYK